MSREALTSTSEQQKQEIALKEKIQQLYKKAHDLRETYNSSKNVPQAEKTLILTQLQEIEQELQKVAIDARAWLQWLFEDVKREITKLEILKTDSMNYSKFLKLSLAERLSYVAFWANFEKVASWETRNISIDFEDKWWKVVKWLENNITIWQLLPRQVEQVQVNWQTFTRQWLTWEFFDNSWVRLLIFNKTEITISKYRSPDDLKAIEEKNKQEYKRYETKDLSKNLLISTSIEKWIDPQFAMLAYWDLYAKAEEKNREEVLEDVLVDFYRIAWANNLSTKLKDWKYSDELALKVILAANWDKAWKEIALKYWIKQETLKSFLDNKTYAMWLKSSDIKNADSREDWTYLKWQELLDNKEFSQALDKLCKNVWISREDLIVVMKAESGLDPRNVNKNSQATWLIQFMPETAIDLKTTTWEIRSMTAVEQLKVIEKFFKKNSHWKVLDTPLKVYQAIFYPVSLLRWSDFVFWSQESMELAQKVKNQNLWVASFSRRPDKLIDQDCFAKYVANRLEKYS